jgi:ATP/ADP translocase
MTQPESDYWLGHCQSAAIWCLVSAIIGPVNWTTFAMVALITFLIALVVFRPG